jgi:hypothetical protein
MMGSGCPLVKGPPAAGRHACEISSHLSTHPRKMALPLSLPTCGLGKRGTSFASSGNVCWTSKPPPTTLSRPPSSMIMTGGGISLSVVGQLLEIG